MHILHYKIHLLLFFTLIFLSKLADSSIELEIFTLDLKAGIFSQNTLESVTETFFVSETPNKIILLTVLNWNHIANGIETITRNNLLKNLSAINPRARAIVYRAWENMTFLILATDSEVRNPISNLSVKMHCDVNSPLQHNTNSILEVSFAYRSNLSLKFSLPYFGGQETAPYNLLPDIHNLIKQATRNQVAANFPHLWIFSGDFGHRSFCTNPLISREKHQKNTLRAQEEDIVSEEQKELERYISKYFYSKYSRLLESKAKLPLDKSKFWEAYFLYFKKFDYFSNSPVKGFDSDLFSEPDYFYPPFFPPDFKPSEMLDFSLSSSPYYPYRTFVATMAQPYGNPIYEILAYKTDVLHPAVDLEQDEMELEDKENAINIEDLGEDIEIIKVLRGYQETSVNLSYLRCLVNLESLKRGKEIKKLLEGKSAKLKLFLNGNTWAIINQNRLSFPYYLDIVVYNKSYGTNSIFVVKSKDGLNEENQIILDVVENSVLNAFDEVSSMLCMRIEFLKPAHLWFGRSLAEIKGKFCTLIRVEDFFDDKNQRKKSLSKIGTLFHDGEEFNKLGAVFFIIDY